MKYFRIERIKLAIEHLQKFHSKWVLIPLVFAVNGVNSADETNITAQDQPGADEFLKQYFSGSLMGLPAFERGVNTLRPRFKDLLGTLRSSGKEDDYVLHQRVGLWANAYSSRGYREMRLKGQIGGAEGSSKFELKASFVPAWQAALPGTFYFEELLVWLYAFTGVPDEVNSWDELFVHFQEKHRGNGGRFPAEYASRFNVNNGIPWDPADFQPQRPTDEEFQAELMPSLQREADAQATIVVDEEDPTYVRVRELLGDGFAGVIFTGPPGTSKSWYAEQVGRMLTDNEPDRLRFVQFHASYQYEDFVEGFVPKDGGGFELLPKHLLEMCETAASSDGKLCVIVIDELSRSDPARVFGEALTYIERTKRDRKFRLASGTEVSIPENIVFLATMNPMDRGVDEVDAALERRFAKIAMDPDSDNLRSYLEERGMAADLVNRLMGFFKHVNGAGNKNQMAKVGHTYFYGARDEQGLHRLWQNQLRFLFEKAYRLDQEGLDEVERRWGKVFTPPPVAPAAPATEEVPESTPQ